MSRAIVVSQGLDAVTFGFVAAFVPPILWESNPLALALYGLGGAVLCVGVKFVLALVLAGVYDRSRPSPRVRALYGLMVGLTSVAALSNVLVLATLVVL